MRFLFLAVSEEAETLLPSFCVQCIIKQLLDSVFVVSRIIKVEVRVNSLTLRLRQITFTSTLIFLDITNTLSNDCLVILLDYILYTLLANIIEAFSSSIANRNLGKSFFQFFSISTILYASRHFQSKSFLTSLTCFSLGKISCEWLSFWHTHLRILHVWFVCIHVVSAGKGNTLEILSFTLHGQHQNWYYILHSNVYSKTNSLCGR